MPDTSRPGACYCNTTSAGRCPNHQTAGEVWAAFHKEVRARAAEPTLAAAADLPWIDPAHLQWIITGVLGALADAGGVPVPDVGDDLAPAVRALVAQRDEALAAHAAELKLRLLMDSTCQRLRDDLREARAQRDEARAKALTLSAALEIPALARAGGVAAERARIVAHLRLRHPEAVCESITLEPDPPSLEGDE